jgi:bacterioferritin-associated ferredoxin
MEAPQMRPDDEVCLCFHVTKRKLVNFLRVERPRKASQMSECFGAGTGCGWCRTYLEKMFEQAKGKPTESPDLEADDYAQGRQQYIRQGHGTPPPGDPLRPKE